MKSQAIAATFKGKNVLITGATFGICESLARHFGAQGANLILVAQTADKLAAIASQLRQQFNVNDGGRIAQAVQLKVWRREVDWLWS